MQGQQEGRHPYLISGAAQRVPLLSGPAAQSKGMLCPEATGRLERVFLSLFHNKRAWEGYKVSLGDAGVLLETASAPRCSRSWGAGAVHPGRGSGQPLSLGGCSVQGLSCCPAPRRPRGHQQGWAQPCRLCGGICQRQGGVLAGLPCAIGWQHVTPRCGDRRRLCPPVGGRLI